MVATMTVIIPMPVYRSSPSSGGYSSYGSLQDPVFEEYEHLPIGSLFAFVYHTGEKRLPTRDDQQLGSMGTPSH